MNSDLNNLQWPHQHSHDMFMEQIYIRFTRQREAAQQDLAFCLDATIPQIINLWSYYMKENKDLRTLNIVLDLLSAAYDKPLLPGFPTDWAINACKNIIQYPE